MSASTTNPDRTAAIASLAADTATRTSSWDPGTPIYEQLAREVSDREWKKLRAEKRTSTWRRRFRDFWIGSALEGRA